ncbi:uncharacterized protein LOC104896462 [Beta vulgaris subsp. vulgaris]|uniref:uncharacterized protein LOC104896462 n=1 Tax=Beta vulgaris subsp. vulgaris TaxID=3555 RepID=UPI0020366E1F|nr:uncharacterized protein LOC104896462 [Beta vulgaris subsp. vulgaris]
MDDMESTFIPNCKHDYIPHRKFLRPDHPFCKKNKAFYGSVEDGVARRPLIGKEVYEQLKGVETIFGKTMKEKKGLWKKESIFWTLPYWKDLKVRHFLDVMHIEKNVCDAILAMLMNIPNKTNDNKASRLYLEEKGVRPELWPQDKKGTKRKKSEKETNIEEDKKGKESEENRNLEKVKVPSGYSSNMKRFVSLNGELKLGFVKSHDCHVMMQVFLPIAIYGILPKHASKVLDPTRLDALQVDVVETLCKFEMYFPPAFFDIMVHLIVHLVREIKLCGPVFLRWCYPFERRMGTLQDKVRNPAQTEASIIQGTVGDEVGNFVAEYLACAEPIGLPTSRHDGRLGGHGTIGSKLVTPPRDRPLQAHLYVLHHVAAVHPYLAEHMKVLQAENPSKGDRALMQLHNKTFIDWFHDRVICQQQDDVSETLKWLAFGPREAVNKYEGYDINGFTFWSEGQDEKSSSLQNSGVSVLASSTFYASAKDRNPVDAKLLYYGRIQEIWELNYSSFKVGLFCCKWICNNLRFVRKDGPCGFTLVDLGHLRESDEPFILATHAKQVFYVRDLVDHKWCIVVPGKISILGISDVDVEEEYDAFEDSPPFINPKIDVTRDADVDTN